MISYIDNTIQGTLDVTAFHPQTCVKATVSHTSSSPMVANHLPTTSFDQLVQLSNVKDILQTWISTILAGNPQYFCDPNDAVTPSSAASSHAVDTLSTTLTTISSISVSPHDHAVDASVLGKKLMQEDNFLGAMRSFTRAVSLRGSIDDHISKGEAMKRLNRHPEAIHEFKKVVQIGKSLRRIEGLPLEGEILGEITATNTSCEGESPTTSLSTASRIIALGYSMIGDVYAKEKQSNRAM